MVDLIWTMQHCIWRNDASKVKKHRFKPVQLATVQLGSHSLVWSRLPIHFYPTLSLRSVLNTFEIIASNPSWITNLKLWQAKQASMHVHFGNQTKHANQFAILELFQTSWEESNLTP